MLGLTLLVKARTAPSWLFWFSVIILIFLFASYFSSHSNLTTVSGLLNGKGGTSSYSLSCKEIFIWGWHYLAVEHWHKVAFDPLEPCCSVCSSPLYTFVLWGKRGIAATPAVLQLPHASQHPCATLLDLWKLLFPLRVPLYTTGFTSASWAGSVSYWAVHDSTLVSRCYCIWLTRIYCRSLDCFNTDLTF